MKKNESFFLLFGDLWKVKAKYIAFFLSALATFKIARGTLLQPHLIINYPACNHMSMLYQTSEWFVVIPFQTMCGT